MFINLYIVRPTYHFILIYTCGLAVVIKRICYVMLWQTGENFLKIHVKIQIVISYVFACNKNKALQLQRVHILSILSWAITLGLWLRPVRLCWYYGK